MRYPLGMPGVVNHLIDIMPSRDRNRLLALCEPVEFSMSEILADSSTQSRHVYFPTGGFVSLLTPIDEPPVLEVGMVGSEGMLGIQIALGLTHGALHARVQGAGSAWRIAAVSFRAELIRSAALRRSLNRYVHVTMLQLTAVARCLRFHQIEARLARWLLMTHDRAHENNFVVTQDSIAYMLGVRRVGVTKAAMELQRRGLIEYARGQMTIVDRAALERAACTCYAADCKTYADFLGN
jgi:CRP-like cAMP-binding protein